MRRETSGSPLVPIDGPVMTGCHWHPSVADHEAIADRLIHFIDERRLAPRVN